MNLIAVLRVMLAFRIVRGLNSNMLHNDYSGPGSVKYLQEPLVKITDTTGPARKLVEFTKSEYLTKEVVEVTRDVYVAIGYALANSIMVVAEKGVIIIDTTENAEAMEEILEEFRKITTKPVVAIVYTHFHGDHNAGTQTVIAEGKSRYPTIPIDIYAHQMTRDTMLDQIYTSDITHIRGVRQFGTSLDKIENWRTGAGLGPELRFFQADEKSIQILPTVTFTGERQTYLVTGIKFELIHTPGETDDQITVWLPDHDVALPGDNIYKTFPNLYAIRGTPARDPLKWYRSLDVVRSLHASHLVGSHTQPVSGKDAVYDTLLAYRDGIKYVHDQTLRYINKGLFPGEIVERVKLPEKLANHPNLQEHYGTVEWSVKGVFANYLGWFSGNPTDLHHVSSAERAIRMLKLITNAQGREECAVEILLREAENSHRSSFYQYQATGQHNKADNKWALELVDFILSLSNVDPEILHSARQIKISALRGLGIEQVSPNGRNYYLTYALEMESDDPFVRSKETRAIAIMDSHIEYILGTLCLKVKGLECQYKNFTIGITFTDIGKRYGLTLRNSVCDVLDPLPSSSPLSASIRTTTEEYKRVNADEWDIDQQIAAGAITVESGHARAYKEFMSCFDPLNSI